MDQSDPTTRAATERRTPWIARPWVVGIAGLTVSLIMALGAHALCIAEASRNLRSRVAEIAAVVRDRHNEKSEVVRATAGLFASSSHVEADEFDRFTRPILARHPGIRRIMYVRSLLPAQRGDVERAFPAREFQIFEPGPQGRAGIAPQRDSYMLVWFEQVQTGVAPLMGADLSPCQGHHLAAAEAATLGRLVVTDAVELPASDGVRGTLLVIPATNAESVASDGFVIAHVSLDRSLEQAVATLDVQNTTVSLRNAGESGAAAAVASFPAGSDAAALANEPGVVTASVGIRIGDRPWTVSAAARAPKYFPAASWLAWAVLGAGAGLSLLASWFAAFSESRSRANAMVRAQHQQLRKVEGMLTESEERFRLLVQGADDRALVMLDAQGHIASWNDGAAALCGLAASAAISQPLHVLYPPERASQAASDLAEAVQRGSSRSEGWHRKPGGDYWAETILTPLRDPSGALRGFACLIWDRTLRKKSEEAVLALNAELEQRVQQRTVQLQRMNSELEAFTYSVSHDLRAPLRHADGFAKLLHKRAGGQLDETSQRYLRTIGESTARMGGLIDDLLKFSRMSKAEMSVSDVDTAALIQSAREELAPALTDRNIEWTIGPLPPVRGDPRLLQLVWNNLISNAVKYTSKNPVAKIEIGSEPGQDGETIFFIHDDGAGFDMQYTSKLFGVFQRLHSAGEFEGTGIGLATVQRIIMRHNGRVWAKGDPGRGASFYFSIPQCGPSESASMKEQAR